MRMRREQSSAICILVTLTCFYSTKLAGCRPHDAYVWVDLREGNIEPWEVDLERAPRKQGFTHFLELLLWEPLKSNAYKINNYLMGRQICLDKMCYLHEIHLLLPT